MDLLETVVLLVIADKREITDSLAPQEGLVVMEAMDFLED